MKSSTFRPASRRFAPSAAALVLLLAAAACNKDGKAPGTTAPAGGGKSPVSMLVTVNAPDAQNRRSAAVEIAATAPLPDGQLMFELPKDCRVLAGAAVRPVKNLGQGKAISQELAFECPPGTSGELKATFKGTDAAGQPLEQVASGPLQ
jgi:hypothetical protein